jgi:hypothetical protein
MIPCRPAHTSTACRMTFGVRRRHGLSCRLVHGHQLRTLNATPTSDTKRDTSSPSFAAARSGVWCMFWCMRKCTTELVEGPCTPPPGGSEAQAPHAQAPAGSRRLPQAPAGSRRLPQDPAGSRRLAPPATHRPRRLQDPTLLSRVCGRREGCGPVLRRSVSTSAIIALQTEIYCSI